MTDQVEICVDLDTLAEAAPGTAYVRAVVPGSDGIVVTLGYPHGGSVNMIVPSPPLAGG